MFDDKFCGYGFVAVADAVGVDAANGVFELFGEFDFFLFDNFEVANDVYGCSWRYKGNAVYFKGVYVSAFDFNDVFNSEAFAGHVDGYSYDLAFVSCYA